MRSNKQNKILSIIEKFRIGIIGIVICPNYDIFIPQLKLPFFVSPPGTRRAAEFGFSNFVPTLKANLFPPPPYFTLLCRHLSPAVKKCRRLGTKNENKAKNAYGKSDKRKTWAKFGDKLKREPGKVVIEMR